MPPRPSTLVSPASRWEPLRALTPARVALGCAGPAQPTGAHLAFQLAHAQARDAVHLALDAPALREGLAHLGHEVLTLHSAAADRPTYLRRPDLGRRLDEASRRTLLEHAGAQGRYMAEEGGACPAKRRHDLALVVADGLSALAVATHAPPFLQGLLARLRNDTGQRWSVAPLCAVAQGRVAVADEIGHLLGARAVVILIGERPGLSSPDSMGLYLTWMPRPGLSDAQRNCISNVRPAGLPLDDAAARLHHLLAQMRRRQVSGVALKDDSAPGLDSSSSDDTDGRHLLVPPAAPGHRRDDG